VPAAKRFDQTDGVLDRARAVEDIQYKIMVQRATQAAGQSHQGSLIFRLLLVACDRVVKRHRRAAWRGIFHPTLPSSAWS
jgi:hypothetical protein